MTTTIPTDYNRTLITWTIRFAQNLPTNVIVGNTILRFIELAWERGDDPWEAASAIAENRFDPDGPRLSGMWDTPPPEYHGDVDGDGEL